ncbi:MAG: ABC transporter permease [Bacteroidales bacterium]
MLLNYLKTSIRFLIKNKSYALINISGLAVGLACFLLIMLYINYHTGYDGFHEKGNRIYRIISGFRDDSFAGTNPVIGPLIARTTPGVESFTRMGRVSWDEKVTVEIDGQKYAESLFYLADSTFFEIFDFPLLIGNPHKVLNDPNKVVITRSTVEKYFGDADPLGQVIRLNDRHDFVVSGIAEDIPGNSHIRFSFLAPFENIERIWGEGSLEAWGRFNYFTYLLMNQPLDPAEIHRRVVRNVTPVLGEDNEYLHVVSSSGFQPFSDIHLEPIRGNWVPAIDTKQLYVFSSIALAILIIACINFVNLSITTSMKRVREISLRKTLGASRNRLYRQFFGETLMIVMISMATAMVLMELLLPEIRHLTDTPVSIPYHKRGFWIFNLFILLAVSTIAGGYTAWYISRLHIKGNLRAISAAPGNVRLRNVLVTIQFVISLVLIIASFTIVRQLNSLRNRQLGMEVTKVINVPLFDPRLRSDLKQIKSAVSNIPGVESVSANRFRPGRDQGHHSIIYEGMEPNEEPGMWLLFADENFASTYEIPVVEGADLTEYSSDVGAAYLLNQSAVKHLGWNDPVGKDFTAMGSNMPGKVVGVVENFHFHSLHHPVEPICILLYERLLDQLSVKCRTDQRTEVMEQIRGIWKKFGGSGDPEFYSVDEAITRQYDTEARMAGLTGYFTVLSILISCLGLYGLISGITRQRNHEIAVRKVFGASAGRIVMILSNKLLVLILVASLLAWPVAWYLMDRWLANFAYPVGLPLWLFAGSTLAAVAVAMLTMSSQTVRAASRNPAEVLKYE